MSRQIDCMCKHSIDHHIYSKGHCLICVCPKANGLMTEAEWHEADTSLQNIADAWNAAGQTFPTLPKDPPPRGRESVRIFWPELASAIENALTKEIEDE